ncbi:glutamate-rich protein 6B [Dipodomys merriami]|uniref:glutamate-rich protein 6B n=1 Tax=Dipodomys merriami TaxID=94247 RepID=UPI00385589A1
MSSSPSSTTPQPSRENLFSKEENIEVELEKDSPQDESLPTEKEKSLEKGEPLADEEHLKDEDFLEGEELLEDEELLEGEELEDEELLEDKELLGDQELLEDKELLGDEELSEDKELLVDEELSEDKELLGDEEPEDDAYLEEEDDLRVREHLRNIEHLEIIEILKDEELLKEEELLQKEKLMRKKQRLKERKKHPKKNLEEEEYLEKEKYLERSKYPFKGKYMKEEEDRKEDIEKIIKREFRMHPSKITPSFSGASTSQGSMFRSKLLSQVSSLSDLDFSDIDSSLDIHPSGMTQPQSLRHQASQTTWAYKKSALDYAAQRSFWSTLMSEPVDRKESEQYSEKFSSIPYTTFQVSEMVSPSEVDDFTDSSLNKQIESESKKKQKKQMKKHLEYRDSVSVSEKEDAPKEFTTYSYILSYETSLEAETKRKEKLEMEKRNTELQNKLELDTEWMQKMTKMHQGDGLLLLYPNKNAFKVLFPDGTGQIYYPSGNLAMLISCTDVAIFTYIVLEDSKNAIIRALINNIGHATFYDRHGKVWSTLSFNLGYYFLEGKRQKAWNWWDIGMHSHAPPVRPITLKLNHYIQVEIRRQDMIIFCFVHKKKHICLHLGTKYKFVDSDVLGEMKAKAVLEVEPGQAVRKIQILLEKISRILKFLTIPDLEMLIKQAKILLMKIMYPRRKKFKI